MPAPIAPPETTPLPKPHLMCRSSPPWRLPSLGRNHHHSALRTTRLQQLLELEARPASAPPTRSQGNAQVQKRGSQGKSGFMATRGSHANGARSCQGLLEGHTFFKGLHVLGVCLLRKPTRIPKKLKHLRVYGWCLAPCQARPSRPITWALSSTLRATSCGARTCRACRGVSAPLGPPHTW